MSTGWRWNRLAASAAVAGMAAVWSFASCTVKDECEDVPCVEYCGGPVVTRACIICPEGLLDDRPVTCMSECYSEEEFETCDHCPEGSFEPDTVAVNWLPCVAECGGPTLGSICSYVQLCPAGTFERSFCELPCMPDAHYCLEQCGGPIVYLDCVPCDVAEGFVDRASCPDADAGADGG